MNRIEQDSLGEITVPAEHKQRAWPFISRTGAKDYAGMRRDFGRAMAGGVPAVCLADGKRHANQYEHQ